MACINDGIRTLDMLETWMSEGRGSYGSLVASTSSGIFFYTIPVDAVSATVFLEGSVLKSDAGFS